MKNLIEVKDVYGTSVFINPASITTVAKGQILLNSGPEETKVECVTIFLGSGMSIKIPNEEWNKIYPVVVEEREPLAK